MAYQTKRTTDDGIVPLGSNLFGTCGTGAGTNVKVVQLNDFNVLVAGVTIHVYFTYSNYASNCYLKVGSTDSKPLLRNGSSYGIWDAGSVISFTYNGAAWLQNDYYNTDTDTDTNTKYDLSISGRTITLTGTDGSTGSVTVPSDAVGDRVYRTSATTYVTIGAGDYSGDILINPGVSNVLGVIGWNISNQDNNGRNASYVNVYACAYYTGYVHVQARNLNSNNSAIVTITVYVLYKG